MNAQNRDVPEGFTAKAPSAAWPQPKNITAKERSSEVARRKNKN
jgi:hypothetical protein